MNNKETFENKRELDEQMEGKQVVITSNSFHKENIIKDDV